MATEIPLYPPVEWFTPPKSMPKDAGCIVEPDGRVYGYLCHWGSVLMDGTNDRWTPPRSKNSYAYAHTGDTQLEDGGMIKTANLGGDFGHAPQGTGDLAATQQFYENTQTQLARVRYGEDSHGVWFAGACWPTVTEFDMAKLRASARSGHWAAVGDWRDMHSGRSGYELVGACLVNVPGLKYARADRAASGVLSFNPVAMASGADHEGAMVALFPDPAVAKALAVEGGEPAGDLHITLAYFDGEAADRQDWDAIHDLVANIGAKYMPLTGSIQGRGEFYAKGNSKVHYASPDVPGLSAMREELVAALALAGFHCRHDHGFTPHITLMYDDTGKLPMPEVGKHDLSFDRLTLAVGGNMTTLSADASRRFGVSGAADLPLHNDRNLAWDSTAADQAIRKWASSDGTGDKETIDWAKYGKAFMWKDPVNDQDFGGYKLGFADVFDGEAQAVWKGVTAVAAALQGSRGGVDIPDADVADVKARVATYYDRFAELFKDDTITPPWEQATVERVASSGTAVFAAAASGVDVGGVLLQEGVVTEDGRLIEVGACSWREVPLPLYATLENTTGHEEASLVGRIDNIWRDQTDPTKVMYYGVVIPTSAGGDGQEAVDAINNEMLKGISIDGIVGPDECYLNEQDISVMTKIVVAGATLTPMPAISTATVTLLSTRTEGFTMDDEAVIDDQVDAAATDVAPAATDQITALSDALAAVADRVEYLIGLVESAQMAARYEAAAARIR